MYHLCPACNIWITQNPSDFNEYTPTMRKKHDQHLFENYINKNVNLVEVDKKLREYVTIHNEKFCYYLIGCDLKVEFDKYFITTMDIGYCDNMDDITNIKFIYYIASTFINQED